MEVAKIVELPETVKKVTQKSHHCAVGNTRTITPAGESWDNWFDTYSGSQLDTIQNYIVACRGTALPCPYECIGLN
ncbi:MAG: hypothetical protein ACIWVG_22095, partial [Gloeotrichia echinulata HAB0833]